MDAMEEDREGRSNGTKRRCDSQRSADSAGGNELSSEQQHGHPLATNRADGTHRRADGVEKAAAEGGSSMLTPAQMQQIAKNREEALRRRRDRACDRPAEAEGEPGVSGRSSGSSGGPLQSSSSSSASTSAANSVEKWERESDRTWGRASVMSGAGTVSGRSGGSSGGLRQSSSSSSASSSAAASGVEMGAGVGPDLELGIRPPGGEPGPGVGPTRAGAEAGVGVHQHPGFRRVQSHRQGTYASIAPPAMTFLSGSNQRRDDNTDRAVFTDMRQREGITGLIEWSQT